MKQNTLQDVWKRVQIGSADECWPWTAAIRPNGYGQFTVNYRTLSPHRVVYELTHGPIAAGLFVCHRCDYPACCNPSHLYAGSAADNTRDMMERGRNRVQFGSEHHSAKLVESQVIEIRRRRRAGERGVDLAAEYGVSPTTIVRLMKDGWPHVREEAA